MSGEATTFQFIGNAFGDEVIYEVNRDAFDKIGSAAQFQRHYGKTFEKQDTLFIIIGTDSGLLANWITRQELPTGSRYIFIEPERLTDTIEPRIEKLEELSDYIKLADQESWKDLIEPFQFQDYAYLNNVKVMQSFAAMDAYLAEYRSLHWDIQNETNNYTWQIEFQMGSQAFVKRQIENIGDNRDKAILLKNAFDGKTATLLGGGPSLDDLIPWVKENRKNLTVIAVSRICRRLIQADIQPDIVVSIDPHPVSFDVSKEMLYYDDKTLLIHSFHVTPLLLSQWHGPSVYFGDRMPWKTKSNGENLPNQGPTVTNTALSMAVHLGFKQIILGGVDLCYDRAGNTHASGSDERAAGPMLGTVGLQVETNGGWMADSRHTFSSAVGIMGGQAEKALEKGCTIINPAPGAAKIPNVEHVLAEDIVIPDEAQTAFEHISEVMPENTSAHRMAHYKEMLKDLTKATGRLRKIIQLSEDALECNDGLFGRNGKTADFKYKIRMDKIEKKLDREYKDISPLVKSFGSRRFLRLVKPDRDREWTDQEIEEWGRAYYEAYQQSAEQLMEMIADVRSRIESRIDEEKPTPDFPALFEQWKNDEAPGRAHVWLHHHQDTAKDLDAESKKGFEALEDEFKGVLENRDTTQAKWCKDNYNLSAVRSKLQVLFQHKEKDELIRTTEELGKNETEEGQVLFALGSGYLAEMNKDIETAFGSYNFIVNNAADKMDENNGQLPRSPELEDALRRMSSLALGAQDSENALLILDTLSALSPIYEPQYAELLRITGNIEDAINIYTDYLKKAPRDYAAMLKLGKLYQQIGVADSARWAYNYVIEQDPENQAASALLAQLGS